jgi:NhaP-type Na+/H+ or K+/H+ antiporter
MASMDIYLISITVIGIAALGMAWMPGITKRTGISYAIAYVLLGMAVYSILEFFPSPDPLRFQTHALRLSELVVIVSIMGTGIKIDRPFQFKTWIVPFRLISVTMLLCIAGVAWIANAFLNFDWASAVLLGAALAPTDPVLASDVQVGPPHEENEENVRFSLTAEAGMNDGMAFPFTWFAIALAIAAGSAPDLQTWVLRDLLYKLIAGVTCGFAMGRLLAFLVFYLPEKKNFIVIRDGFVGISATLLIYGITELLHGYGFIAVFVTAITLRNYERHHKYHKKLHDFTDQVERILVAIVLILFGGSLVSGVLDKLTWPMALLGLGFLFLIRPVSGLLGLLRLNLHMYERLAVSFFGIRGIGSFFYVAFAIKQADFKFAEEIWSLVSFIVLVSIVIHGLTATRVMKIFERRLS